MVTAWGVTGPLKPAPLQASFTAARPCLTIAAVLLLVCAVDADTSSTSARGGETGHLSGKPQWSRKLLQAVGYLPSFTAGGLNLAFFTQFNVLDGVGKPGRIRPINPAFDRIQGIGHLCGTSSIAAANLPTCQPVPGLEGPVFPIAVPGKRRRLFSGLLMSGSSSRGASTKPELKISRWGLSA